MVERAGKMAPGDPLDPKTRLGPVISQEQMERVLGYIEKGKDEGAKLVLGGGRPKGMSRFGNGDTFTGARITNAHQPIAGRQCVESSF